MPPSSPLHDLPTDLVYHILDLLWPDKRPSRFSKVEVCQSACYRIVFKRLQPLAAPVLLTNSQLYMRSGRVVCPLQRQAAVLSLSNMLTMHASAHQAREWCQYATVCQSWRRFFRCKRVSFMFTHGSVPPAVQQWLAHPGAPPADIACVTVPYRWIDQEDSP